MNNLGYHRVTWKITSIKLLPRPYKTDCKDYTTTTEYISRDDCFKKCKLQLNNHKCRAVFQGDSIRKDEPGIIFSEPNDCSKKIDFFSICNKRCKQTECNFEYYRPVLLREFCCYSDNIGTVMNLVIPSEPQITFNHEPKLRKVEFICYLASTISMWFGISFYSLYFMLKSFRCALFKKNKLANSYTINKSKTNKNCQIPRRVKLYSLNNYEGKIYNSTNRQSLSEF